MSTVEAQFELVRFEDRAGWRKLSAEQVYVSPHVQVEQVRFETPARGTRPVSWSVVTRKAGVAIVPMLEDGRFLLVHQERIPVQRTLWEFPAGQIDVPVADITHEKIISTARAELMEEVGCELESESSLRSLGYFFSSQGFTQEHNYLFLAQPVRKVSEPQPVGEEQIAAVRCVTSAELRQMVASNDITNGLTLALFAKLAALGIV